MHYLCSEFLANYKEAQDQSKTFHYAWLVLSIVLVTWELPKDSQFPLIASDLPEVAKFASLWATKDLKRFKESKIFWVLMEASIHAAINHKSWLSPIIF